LASANNHPPQQAPYLDDRTPTLAGQSTAKHLSSRPQTGGAEHDHLLVELERESAPPSGLTEQCVTLVECVACDANTPRYDSQPGGVDLYVPKLVEREGRDKDRVQRLETLSS
jgi:hypothetical protein